MAMLIKSHRELDVYKRALNAAVTIHRLVQRFPPEERRRLGDQVLRSCRSVCGCIAEMWRKRRYVAHFTSKITDAQAEAAETQVWLEFASRVELVKPTEFEELFNVYETIIAQLSVMSRDAHKWTKR